MQERVQAAEALRVEAQLKRAALERDHMRRLEAVRDSNRRKTLRDAVAWLRQAARTPHEANMHRWGVQLRGISNLCKCLFTLIIFMAGMGSASGPKGHCPE